MNGLPVTPTTQRRARRRTTGPPGWQLHPMAGRVVVLATVGSLATAVRVQRGLHAVYGVPCRCPRPRFPTPAARRAHPRPQHNRVHECRGGRGHWAPPQQRGRMGHRDERTAPGSDRRSAPGLVQSPSIGLVEALGSLLPAGSTPSPTTGSPPTAPTSAPSSEQPTHSNEQGEPAWTTSGRARNQMICPCAGTGTRAQRGQTKLVGFTALMATLVLSVIICNAVIPRYLSDPTTLTRSKLVAALTVAALGALMLYTLLQEVGRALLRRSARRRA